MFLFVFRAHGADMRLGALIQKRQIQTESIMYHFAVVDVVIQTDGEILKKVKQVFYVGAVFFGHFIPSLLRPQDGKGIVHSGGGVIVVQKREGFFLFGEFARLVDLIKRNGKPANADNGENVGGYPRKHYQNRPGGLVNAFGCRQHLCGRRLNLADAFGGAGVCHWFLLVGDGMLLNIH